MNFSPTEWHAALPALIPGLTAVALLVLDLMPRLGKGLVLGVSLLGLGLAAALDLPYWTNPAAQVLGKMMAADGYAVFFQLLFLLIGALSLLLSWERLSAGYAALLLWATTGMMILSAATNLMTVFLGMELLSLSLYVLVGYSRRGDGEAAIKYLLLGALATGFLLYGMALLYGGLGTISFSAISLRLFHSTGSAINFSLILPGLGLVLVGLFFKLALVPFQNWAPDVYQGAPAPVTAFMSVGTKAAVFAVALRFLLSAVPALLFTWLPLLGFLAVASMLLGNIMALKQTNVVRLLAYSGIAHAGYLIVALLSLPWGAATSLYYLVAYAFTNLGAFAGVIILGGKEGNFELDSWNGLYRRRPLLAAVLAIFLLSLAGVPPTAGFFAKFYLLQGALFAQRMPLVIALVIASGISLYVYFRVVLRLFSVQQTEAETTSPTIPIPLLAVLVISLIGTVGLGLFPSALVAAAQQSALSIIPLP